MDERLPTWRALKSLVDRLESGQLAEGSDAMNVVEVEGVGKVVEDLVRQAELKRGQSTTKGKKEKQGQVLWKVDGDGDSEDKVVSWRKVENLLFPSFPAPLQFPWGFSQDEWAYSEKFRIEGNHDKIINHNPKAKGRSSCSSSPTWRRKRHESLPRSTLASPTGRCSKGLIDRSTAMDGGGGRRKEGTIISTRTKSDPSREREREKERERKRRQTHLSMIAL
jgi:hypothetical protein